MWAFPGERGIYNFFLPGSVQFGWMSCCSLSWWGHQWDISPLGSWFSWNQKKFLRALLSYHIWLSLVKGSNLAGDRKANSSNETEQRHKPVSSKKRRLNIIFLFKSKFSSGVVNSQGIFFCFLGRHAWRQLLQAAPTKGVCTNTHRQDMQLRQHAVLLSWLQKRAGKFIKSTEAAIMFTGDTADRTRSWVWTEKATEQSSSRRRFSLGLVQESSHNMAASRMHAP